jgi:MFS transporter, FHS family, L-fucose permease
MQSLWSGSGRTTMQTTAQSTVAVSETTQDYRRPLAVVTTLFFMWGFLTSLNDILVPHLKAIFDLSYAKVMLIQFAFFSAYFFFSLPSGKIIEWIGYKGTMVAGLITMGIGALLFLPAAGVPSYPLFLTALIVLAAGITALQVAANPYVAVLGSPKTASSRLNLTQAFNSFGTTIGPYLGALFILGGAALSSDQMKALSPEALHAYRLHEASSVKLPYLGLAVALLLLGLAIALSKLPKIESAEDHHEGPRHSIWEYPHLILGAVGIFVYVGGEVAIGSFLANYISQPEIGNMPINVAATFISYYWGGAMIGRFIGSGLLQKISTQKLLGAAAIVAGLLVVTSMLSFGHVAMWSIIFVGFFNSIMFPSIFTLAIDGLGPLTGKGSSLLVCAIVGGAVIPELQGLLADKIGIHNAFIFPVMCYAYIAYYALIGSRKKSAALQAAS